MVTKAMKDNSDTSGESTQTVADFVHRRGAQLCVGDEPYRVVGCNTYYLMAWAADPGLRSHVDQLLDTAADAGLNTLRTWAFNDGEDQWNALQPRPGVHDERVLEALDYVVWQAGERDLLGALP
jgi:mannan endo-1,4-beta-mannosidase